MNALSLILKVGVVAGVLTFASGTMKDVLLGTLDSVSINAAHAQMKQLHGKLMEHYSLHGRYPKTQNELHNFLHKEFDTPLEQVLLDPWKSPYYFLTPKYEILCLGPDKKGQTKDDFGYSYPQHILQAAHRKSKSMTRQTNPKQRTRPRGRR